MMLRRGGIRFSDGENQVFRMTALRTETLWDRTRGLLGREALAEEQGLLIDPCNSVHTFGMRYAIDLVYITRDGSVAKIIRSLGPRRLSFCWRAGAVLELLSGAADRLGVKQGMRMQWHDDDC